jgi:hypothetical protein
MQTSLQSSVELSVVVVRYKWPGKSETPFALFVRGHRSRSDSRSPLLKYGSGGDDLQNARTPVARPAKRGRNGTADRTGSASGFPIRGQLSGTRITTPIAT